MNRTVFDFQAEVCKAFANPRRLQILNLLKSGELSVSDITRTLGTSKANASQNLAVMRLRGLLRTRREGTNIYYRIANDELAQACNLMQNALKKILREKNRAERTQTGVAFPDGASREPADQSGL